MKKITLMLRKCKTLSRQLGRTSSYSSLRSKSAREEIWGATGADDMQDDDHCETVFVGRSRRRYVVSSKYLNHPLLSALIQKSKDKSGQHDISVKCEVVLFDHLLWMLENADPDLSADSLEELAELYVL